MFSVTLPKVLKSRIHSKEVRFAPWVLRLACLAATVSCLPTPRSTECAPCGQDAECGIGSACTLGVCVRTDGAKSPCAAVDCKPCTESNQCGAKSQCIRGKCVANGKSLSTCLSYDQILCESCENVERCGDGFSCERTVCIARDLPLGRCLAAGAVNCSDCTSIRCGYSFSCTKGICVDPKLSPCVAGEPPKLCANCNASTPCETGSTCKSGRCIINQKPLTDCFTFPDGVRCLSCSSDAECGDNSQCKKGKCIPQGTALTECLSPADVACESCTGPDDCDKAGGFRCLKGRCLANDAAYSACLGADDVKCLQCSSAANCGAGYQCGAGTCQLVTAGLAACFSPAEVECRACAGGIVCGAGFVCRGTPANAQPNVCIADGKSLRSCVNSTGFVGGKPVNVSTTQPTVLIATNYDNGGLDVGYFSPWPGNQNSSSGGAPVLRPNDKVTIFGSIAENDQPLPRLFTAENEWFQYSISVPQGTYRVELELDNYYSASSGLKRFVDVFFSDGSRPLQETKLGQPVLGASTFDGQHFWTTGPTLLTVASNAPGARLRVQVSSTSMPPTNQSGLAFRRIRLVRQ